MGSSQNKLINVLTSKKILPKLMELNALRGELDGDASYGTQKGTESVPAQKYSKM